jgi:hypothetical protein
MRSQRLSIIVGNVALRQAIFERQSLKLCA